MGIQGWHRTRLKVRPALRQSGRRLKTGAFGVTETYARVCHLTGLGLMVIAMAMLMTPAVYYRAQHGHATSLMVKASRRMIRGALMPLALGMSLDELTVMSLATDNLAFSIAAAFATLLLFVGLWYILPRRDPIQVDEPRS